MVYSERTRSVDSCFSVVILNHGLTRESTSRMPTGMSEIYCGLTKARTKVCKAQPYLREATISQWEIGNSEYVTNRQYIYICTYSIERPHLTLGPHLVFGPNLILGPILTFRLHLIRAPYHVPLWCYFCIAF